HALRRREVVGRGARGAALCDRGDDGAEAPDVQLTACVIEQRGDPRELGPWLDGHDVADVYDAWCASLETLDTEGAVAALAELAGDGPVLELAIGTGRLALPLAARGLEVQGIDASADMVAKLHEKPGGDEILVTIGDLVDVAVSGSFSLVFIVFNTFFGLRSADDQARCFRNVRAHLTEGGLFVIECPCRT